MAMDRVLEPTFQPAGVSRGLLGLPLRALGSVFWPVADLVYAAWTTISGDRQTFPADLVAVPEDAPRTPLHHVARHWPTAALGGLTAFALVMSQASPSHSSARVHTRINVTPRQVVYAATEAPRSHRTPPPAPAELQQQLAELATRYHEPVGVAVSDVDKGWVASVAGDSPFPQQSVSKLWVAITALDAIDNGRLKLDQSIVLGPQDRSVFNQPIAYRIENSGYTTTVHDLLRRALIQSDNAANDKLMATVGGPAAVLEVLRRKEIEGISLAEDEKHLQAHIAGLVWSPALSPFGAFDQARARLPHDVREAAMAAYLANPYDGATPIGMVSALAALKRGELLSKESTDVILATMAQATTGPRRLRGGLPRDWHIAHKTGTGQDFKGASIGINDVAVLTAPDGHAYTVAVLMRRTAKPVSERLEFMQSISKAVVAYWETHRDIAPTQTIAQLKTHGASTGD
jgi:beta-lactamase class A